MKSTYQSQARLLFVSAVLTLCTARSVLAQWVNQTNTLSPGWNAIYLEAQPEPDDPDVVFAGLPVESVWVWDRKVAPSQFIQDANTLVPKQPEWLTYFPIGHPQRSLRNLFAVKGGRALLLKLNGSVPVTWVVAGKPVLPSSDWIPDTPNLRGFHINDAASATFRTYLSGSPAHAGKIIYSLNSSGKWSIISDTTSIQRGKAYWIQTVGASSYQGPLYVEPDLNSGLDFGLAAAERRVRLRNDGSNATRNVTVRLVPTSNRPRAATNSPATAGQVVLSYWNYSVSNLTNVVLQWKPFSSPLTVTLAPGSESTFRFAARRKDFAASSAPPGVNVSYQGILEFSDDAGSRVLVPVSATPTSTGTTTTALKSPPPDPRAGLWVGTVSVTNVSWVGASSTNIVQANPAFNSGDRITPRPTSSEFQFRILLHVDASGDVRLLQKVMEVWTNGTWTTDPANPGLSLPGTPGSYRLFTDETLAASYLGSAERDGKPVARRLSTPIYALRAPLLLTKNGDFGTGSLSGTVITGYDDNLNPFKHQYHPDHDNYNALYSTKLPAGVESYDIRRDLQLNFTSADPTGGNSPAWQDAIVGGDYLETLTGVHREPIHVKGSFLIRRVSTVSNLN
jgi:hypothetical protein